MLLRYTAVAMLGLLFRTFLFIRPILTDNQHQIVSLAVSFSAVPLIFYFKRPIPFFAKIGYYAFGIHIFNRIAVSIARSLFEHYHYQNTGIQFVVYMAFGVTLAIMTQIMLEQFAFTRKYILGLKNVKHRSPIGEQPVMDPAGAAVYLNESPSWAATRDIPSIMDSSKVVNI
jgi:hypothetical protein